MQRRSRRAGPWTRLVFRKRPTGSPAAGRRRKPGAIASPWGTRRRSRPTWTTSSEVSWTLSYPSFRVARRPVGMISLPDPTRGESMTPRARFLAVLIASLAIAVPGAARAASFVTFESDQVRPLALSPDHAHLFAVNTPDDRLEVFDVDGSGNLTHGGSVVVGLEPVAVAARTNGEVWVVNHLSDSVSIIDVSSNPPRVTRTLLVGDEPRDIVFAGTGGNRAFITTAHRGQNSGVPPTELTTEGLGRADVWVFDATNLGTGLGGTALTKLTFFGDTPRALAASPSGNRVYAAVFHSGNRTASINEVAVCNDASGAANNTVAPACTISGATLPGGTPNPDTNVQGV